MVMLTIPQVTAILSILMAFGVSTSTVDKVQTILMPTAPTTTPVQVIQTPVVANEPVYFGSSITTIMSTSSVSSDTMPTQAPQPQYSLLVTKRLNGKTVDALVGTVTDVFGIAVEVHGPDGKYVKEPVTVTTDDPDFADSTFTINRPDIPGDANFFCVAPHSSPFVNNGCPITNPVATGTFTFTLSSKDASTTVSVTIN